MTRSSRREPIPPREPPTEFFGYEREGEEEEDPRDEIPETCMVCCPPADPIDFKDKSSLPFCEDHDQDDLEVMRQRADERRYEEMKEEMEEKRI